MYCFCPVCQCLCFLSDINESNCFKFFFFLQEAWLLSRERELKDELRRERDKEIELAIWTLEEETSKDKEECERAADNR